MKKGFTLFELMLSVTILSVIIAIVAGIISGTYNDNDNGFDFSRIDPQYESAKNSRKIAEQLERQNDLMERQLEQQNDLMERQLEQQKNSEKNQ